MNPSTSLGFPSTPFDFAQGASSGWQLRARNEYLRMNNKKTLVIAMNPPEADEEAIPN